ncbi:HNH endonuclease [Streptomyces sp. NPDC058525]|uniref:HNH endonuclease n=1 Tax=Streptomyces sp. NPDC058525 TaxID=3346538 RepID=UPI0036465901
MAGGCQRLAVPCRHAQRSDHTGVRVQGHRGARRVGTRCVPLHEAGEGRTKLSDLALICANCHRMIHRRAPWPTPRELRAFIELKHVADERAAEIIGRPRRAADEQAEPLA